MFIQFLRRVFRIMMGKDLYVRTTRRENKEWYGSGYGGFYLCPDNLTEGSVIYSFGIGEDITFDLEVIGKHKSSVYAFDPTPKSISWLSRQSLPMQFKFFQYGIALKSGPAEFYLPRNEDYVSGSLVKNASVNEHRKIVVPMKAFSEIVKELDHKNISVVKMDIEGAEYEVLPSILESDVVIEQIVIEFHHRMIENGMNKTRDMLRLLRKKGYDIFAVSDNAEEISFIKRSSTGQSTTSS